MAWNEKRKCAKCGGDALRRGRGQLVLEGVFLIAFSLVLFIVLPVAPLGILLLLVPVVMGIDSMVRERKFKCRSCGNKFLP